MKKKSFGRWVGWGKKDTKNTSIYNKQRGDGGGGSRHCSIVSCYFGKACGS